MKKVFFTLMLSLSLTSVNAQTNEFSSSSVDRQMGTTTKGGQKILPQAGDFALGIDASPALKYVGNIFNGNTNNNANSVFGYNKNVFDAPSIYGKYFLSDNTAIRAKLHLGFSSDKETDLVPKYDDANVDVEDITTFSKSGLGLSVGYEIRRGYGRLQGFFGPELGVGFQSESITKDYGNPLNSITAPTQSGRILKASVGSTFTVKAGGFVGVEYFVAPKISLGAEYGLAIAYSNTGKGKTESESWKAADDKVEKDERETGGNSEFKFYTLSSGALNLTFHF